MRALRILLIFVVVVGVLFAVVDRVAVHLAQGQAADRLKSAENLASTPDVSIKGFPFLTQLASGELDDVEVGVRDYEVATGNGARKIRVDGFTADLKGVRFSGDYRSATAATATGTATIAYDELLKAAKSDSAKVAPGVTARVVGLSDGGDGKIKVDIEVKFSVLGLKDKQRVSLRSSAAVRGDKVEVRADSLPVVGGVRLPEGPVRSITDFQQAIDRLPTGIELDSVRAAADGVEITLKGSDVELAG
ncbi:LmeA family phospholipid-binding protein [Streptomyces cyslabdanicus]|uniref:LmeA family phospholipid-binding protein n=1 Tax=Streptomyces cyslabdanicus TaxID=1470456 RepID=UPI004043F4CD